MKSRTSQTSPTGPTSPAADDLQREDAPAPLAPDERVALFKRELRARYGMSLSDLARACKSNRAHISQVINGKLKGRHTWKHLEDVLDYELIRIVRAQRIDDSE